MLNMWPTMATWFFVLVVLLQSVCAQILSEASCLPQFSILANSRGQSPCLVAGYVQGACTGGQWTVPVLAADTHYTGPPKEKIDLCQCSTVVYNLISACALCQSELFITWTDWATNCTTNLISLGTYRVPIPPATAIPAWAYWNPVGNGDLFSLAALSGAQGPESSAVPPPPPPSASPQPQPQPQPQAPSGSSGGSSSPNVGAIAGGVVGGIFVIGLIAGLIIWLVKRKDSPTSQIPAPAPYNVYPNMTPGPTPTHPKILATASSPPPAYSHSIIPPSDPLTHYSNPRPEVTELPTTTSKSRRVTGAS